MAYAYRLLSDEEALRALHLQQAPSDINNVLDSVNAASQAIQDYLDRIIIQQTWIEYHEVDWNEPSVLRVLHWPISSITSIYEDPDRDYGSSSLLTASTDYVADNATGRIIRVDGSSSISWDTGFEAIKITLVGCYLIADVPPEVKDVCGEYAARKYHARVNQEHAFQSVNNMTGTVSHFGPVMLTAPMKQRLAEYKDFGATTAVRWEISS